MLDTENNRRLASKLSDAVDECILMYERGNDKLAIETLSRLGFSAMSIHRILMNPDHRRRYINAMIEGN
jgi:hypothetical protein